MSNEEEKLNRYFNRTLEHIHRVQKNMFLLITKYGEDLELSIDKKQTLALNVLRHDRSKFNSIQMIPYIELTEYYHQRKKLGNKSYEYPTPQIRKDVERAVENHYKCENHHAEKHKGIAALMADNEIVEMICDLQAMAQEFNEGSCRGFFKNVWCNKYDVSNRVLALADLVITCFEKELEA